MKNLVLSAMLTFFIVGSTQSVFARDADLLEAQKAELDKIAFRLIEYESRFPRKICGTGYHGPTEEERKSTQEILEFKAESKQVLKKMGPQAIPLLIEGLQGNFRILDETIIDTLSEMGAPVFSEIEKCLNDGRISDCRNTGSDFPVFFEILKKSKTDYTNLISNTLKSKNPNCRLFALKAMSKLQKPISALNVLVEKSASDPNENIRRAAIELLAIDANDNKSHFDIVLEALQNDETSLVRSNAINAICLQSNKLSKENKSKLDAVLLKVMKTDNMKLVRDYASYQFNPNERKRINDEFPAPTFSLSTKDSIYSRALPKPIQLDKNREAALDASVASILEQVIHESANIRSGNKSQRYSSQNYRAQSAYNFYKYERFIRTKEMELRSLGADGLKALIKHSQQGNVDVSTACTNTILWFGYDSLPYFVNALEGNESSQSLSYVICGLGARSNAVFEQVLSESSDNAKVNALEILSYELPRLNHHKSIPHPIEVTPKLIRLIEKCMNSPNNKIQELAKTVREQIDYSNWVLLVGHHT